MSPRKYAVKIGPAAKKDFRKLPRDVQRKIKPVIDNLCANPRPAGVESVKGIRAAYRLRVGSFRVVYQVKDREVVVLVLRIGDRKEIYDMIRRIKK